MDVLTQETLKKIFSISFYTLPQYIWILLLYYIMLNSLSDLFISEILSDYIPKHVKELNQVALDFLEQYQWFVLFLSLGLFISGFFITILKIIPYLNNFQSMFIAGKQGIDYGFWLFLMWATIYFYNSVGKCFIIIFFVASLIIPALIEWIFNKKNSKY